jgi:hypothetical protein
MFFSQAYKVDVFESNIGIIWTYVFEWYVIRCGFEDGHQKHIMGSLEIGLCVQNMLTILRLQ